jgi:hypothetical protein
LKNAVELFIKFDCFVSYHRGHRELREKQTVIFCVPCALRG